MSSLATLQNPLEWVFFAEGAANILFESSQPQFKGKLLRLRKDIEGTPSTLEVYEFLQAQILPHLHQYYVDTKIVKLDESFVKGLIESEAGQGKRKDAAISLKDPHGLLIEAVVPIIREVPDRLLLTSASTLTYSSESPTESSFQHNIIPLKHLDLRRFYDEECQIGEILFEFKPKWLLPSPNAPHNAHVCRTCALRQLRNKPPGLCPLDLTSHDPDRIEQAIKVYLLSGFEKHLNLPLPSIITHALLDQPVLRILQQLQALDSRGILGYDENEPLDMKFITAMTCRDCTMFFNILYSKETLHGNPEYKPLQDEKYDFSVYENASSINIDGYYAKVRILVADLDVKSSDGLKRKYWSNIETQLIEGGYYLRDSTHICY